GSVNRRDHRTGCGKRQGTGSTHQDPPRAALFRRRSTKPQPPENNPKSVWKSQKIEGVTMSAQEIRQKAQRLDAENRRDITIGFMVTLVLTVFGLIGLLTLQRLEFAARVIIAIALLLVWAGAWYDNSKKPRVLTADA